MESMDLLLATVIVVLVIWSMSAAVRLTILPAILDRLPEGRLPRLLRWLVEFAVGWIIPVFFIAALAGNGPGQPGLLQIIFTYFVVAVVGGLLVFLLEAVLDRLAPQAGRWLRRAFGDPRDAN